MGSSNNEFPFSSLESPLFVKPLESAVGVDGSPVQLDCKVSGDPIPEIKW